MRWICPKRPGLVLQLLLQLFHLSMASKATCKESIAETEYLNKFQFFFGPVDVSHVVFTILYLRSSPRRTSINNASSTVVHGLSWHWAVQGRIESWNFVRSFQQTFHGGQDCPGSLWKWGIYRDIPIKWNSNRRKFRSQTSDNMDRWKAEMGRVREKRRVKREDQRRERVRRKKMQMREKVQKSQNTVFFQWFVAPEDRKVGSLKRWVRSHLARWEMKNCTPLWREMARNTFRSQNVQNTPFSDHFWKLRCRKSARRCGAKHISKSKCAKHTILGPLLEGEMSKKCTPWWREAHLQVRKLKTFHVRSTSCSRHFWTLRCRFAWQAQGIVHLVKSEQNVRVSCHFQKRWQAWDIWRGSAKMHFPWQVQQKRHVHQSC